MSSALIELITSVVKGAFFLLFLGLIGFVFWWIYKQLNLGRFFKRRKKVPEDIYLDVGKKLIKGETFDDIAIYFSKSNTALLYSAHCTHVQWHLLWMRLLFQSTLPWVSS